MNDDNDNILRRLMKNRKETVDGKGCLPEEMFAAYFYNLLSDKEKEQVEGHLSGCRDCRENSIAYYKVKSRITQEPLLKAPARLTAKAKQLVIASPVEDLIQVILKFAKDSIRVVKDTASIIKPLELLPAGIRAGAPEHTKQIVLLGKKFDELRADIIIERTGDDICDIEVKTTDASGLSLNNVRLNLVSEKRELASYLTRNGRAIFKNIGCGNYNLIIMEGNKSVGDIQIQLEPEK